jgi:hypothetical protein
MPRQIVAKARFLRAYHRLSEADQGLVDSALKHFQHYLQTGQAPVGLGIKHVGARTYELRVNLALRIVYVIEGNSAALYLLGNHDEVRRFLRRQ